MNLDKHIWEGWTVQDFIDDLTPSLDMIMAGRSHQKSFEDKKSLNAWLKSNQPYYKKPIKEVQQYFAKKYNLQL